MPVHDIETRRAVMLAATRYRKDATVIIFLLGLSIGASCGVVIAGICFASHLRDTENGGPYIPSTDR